MMKTLVFDTGPIISLALNNLLWILDPLSHKTGTRFVITESVKEEMIDRPFNTKKFKFEALQTFQYIKNGTIKVGTAKGIDEYTTELMECANHCFKAKGEWIKLVHYAEMQVLALAKLIKADACVVDERTARMLVEDPERLKDILKKKTRARITINREYLAKFNRMTKGIKMIRSIELIIVAYERGYLDRYLPDIPDARKHLLDSLLWALKLNGSSVSNREIQQIIKIEQTRFKQND